MYWTLDAKEEFEDFSFSNGDRWAAQVKGKLSLERKVRSKKPIEGRERNPSHTHNWQPRGARRDLSQKKNKTEIWSR